MRIFYDYQTFSNREYGGIARYFVELAARIAKYPEAEVRVVSPIIRSLFLAEHKSDFRTVGIDTSKIRNLPRRIVRPLNYALFRLYAEAARPDIVHETFHLRWRTAPKSARVVATIHDTTPERLPQFFPSIKGLVPERLAVIRNADRIICVSESTRTDLLDLYKIDPAKVTVARLGCSFMPTTGKPAEIGAPYFLNVGSRYSYKNFSGLVKAFAESGLFRTHKLVSFTAQQFTARELAEIQAAGVPLDAVVRVGGTDDLLARYYAGAEALVFPSMYEGFGIPLLEAMRCGCPIITSDISSMPEVAGEAALYCNPGDIASIAEAMVKMASSPETRTRLIAAGLQRAKEFSWDRCAAETMAVYRSLQ